MEATQQQQVIPPLAALVYRSGKGCRQYAFASADDLAAFAARHPYRNEMLRVMAFKDRKQVSDVWIHAAEAADYVRCVRAESDSEVAG